MQSAPAPSRKASRCSGANCGRSVPHRKHTGRPRHVLPRQDIETGLEPRLAEQHDRNRPRAGEKRRRDGKARPPFLQEIEGQGLREKPVVDSAPQLLGHDVRPLAEEPCETVLEGHEHHRARRQRLTLRRDDLDPVRQAVGETAGKVEGERRKRLLASPERHEGPPRRPGLGDLRFIDDGAQGCIARMRDGGPALEAETAEPCHPPGRDLAQAPLRSVLEIHGSRPSRPD